MAGNIQNCLNRAGTDSNWLEHNWEWMDMAESGKKLLEVVKTARNGRKSLKWQKMAGNGWKLLEHTRNGLKWQTFMECA